MYTLQGSLSSPFCAFLPALQSVWILFWCLPMPYQTFGLRHNKLLVESNSRGLWGPSAVILNYCEGMSSRLQTHSYGFVQVTEPISKSSLVHFMASLLNQNLKAGFILCCERVVEHRVQGTVFWLSSCLITSYLSVGINVPFSDVLNCFASVFRLHVLSQFGVNWVLAPVASKAAVRLFKFVPHFGHCSKTKPTRGATGNIL